MQGHADGVRLPMILLALCRTKDPAVSILDGSWYMPNAGKPRNSPRSNAQGDQGALPRIWQKLSTAKGCFCHYLCLEICGLKSDGCFDPARTGRDPRKEFEEERIPGSRFFDLDRISAPDTNLPHMLPSEQAFSAAADALGIGQDSKVCPWKSVRHLLSFA